MPPFLFPSFPLLLTMPYTAKENTPITVNLLNAANDTGWTLNGGIATHDSCNAGFLRVLTKQLIPGHTYQVSYTIQTISSGYVQAYLGAAQGIQNSAAGVHTETITAAGTSPVLQLYATGNCTVTSAVYRDTAFDSSNLQQNTIMYNALLRKWISFLTFTPDVGLSLGTNTYSFNQAAMYAHVAGSPSRNNFYGNQYKSLINMPFSPQSTSVHKFKSMSLQVNELMITTEDGITTSLGQVSELIDLDMLKDTLIDVSGATVQIYSKEGVYSARFMRDKNININEGDELRGNWITIQLQTVDGTQHLELFTVAVNTKDSKIGVR